LGQSTTAYAAASGSANYIQNTTSQQTSANFNIDGTGVAGALQSSVIQSAAATALTITGNAASTWSTSAGLLTLLGGGGLTLNSATTNALTIDSGTTGAINIATNTSAKTINIGTGGTGVKTINIGGTAANVLSIGNTQTAGSISLGAAMTTGTINIGGTGAQTGAISLGAGTGAQAINLGTGGTGAKTVTVGSTASTGATTIQAGSGGIGLATAGAITLQGSSGSVFKGTSGAFTTTLGFVIPTANNSISLPNESGTICLQASTNCGFLTPAAANSSYIQLQTNSPGSVQTGNFDISGKGIAATLQGSTSVLTPTLDTASAAPLNIGTTNASQINLNKNVTVAAGQYISLVGGITSTRPASPTAGMLYYDTTTKSLLVYSNGKWQADRSTATKIVADGSTSQNPDSADYVVPAAATNAEATINSAIAALPAGGGTVYLREGTYTVSGSITLPSNVTLAGSGAATVIKQAGSSNLSVGLIQNSDATNGNDHITVRDLKLDGNKANQGSGAANGIKFTKVGAGSTVGAAITNVWADNFTFNTVWLLNSSHITMTNLSVRYSEAQGVYFDNTAYSILTGSNVSDTPASGGDGVGLSNGASHNTISNNTLTDNLATAGIGLYSGFNTISNNTIRNNFMGVIAVDATNNIVTGNSFSGNQANAIYMESSSDNLFDANAFSDNGAGILDSPLYAVMSSLNNTISNNQFSDTDGTSYAISIDSTSIGNTLKGNSFGTGSNGMWLSGTPINADGAAHTVYSNQIDNLGNIYTSSAKTSGLFQSADGSNNTSPTLVTRVQGSSTADLFQLQNTTGNTLTKFTSNGDLTIGGANSAASANALRIQDASNRAVMTADTSSGKVLFGQASALQGQLIIYNSSNNNTVTIATGVTSASYTLTLPTSAGLSGQCLQATDGSGSLGWGSCGGSGGGTGGGAVTLVPEYPGAVFVADGTSNVGFMTTDRISGLSSTEGYKHNFYSWSTDQANEQDYNVTVGYQLPASFNAATWSNLALWVYADAPSSANGSVDYNIQDADGTTCSSGTLTPSINGVWEKKGLTTPSTSGSCSFTASDVITITFTIKSIAPQSNTVKIGEFSYAY
jgi:parallel beta-helix repeat protein